MDPNENDKNDESKETTATTETKVIDPMQRVRDNLKEFAKKIELKVLGDTFEEQGMNRPTPGRFNSYLDDDEFLDDTIDLLVKELEKDMKNVVKVKVEPTTQSKRRCVDKNE